ncbi:MAG TPA: phosphotransferase [Firmicutes bacterium]|nr:phosphotransferase [Bacillota bacterium]
MKELLEKWGCEFAEAEILPFEDGVWRVQLGRETYILKHRATRSRVWEEYELLNWLTDKGHPISPLIFTKDGAPWAEYQLGIYVLYRYVEGTPGDKLGGYTQSFIDEAAQTLARLHLALAEYEASDAFPVFDVFQETASYAWPSVQAHAAVKFGHGLHALEETLGGELVNPYEALPRQLIHRDFHPGNLVFRDGKVVGILDFDRVRLGVRLFDLGYLATAILSEGFDDPKKRQEWPDVLKRLVAAYDSVAPLTKTEGFALIYIIYLIQLLFTAHFLDLGRTDLADKNLAMLLWIYDQQDFLQPVIENMVASNG